MTEATLHLLHDMAAGLAANLCISAGVGQLIGVGVGLALTPCLPLAGMVLGAVTGSLIRSLHQEKWVLVWGYGYRRIQ